MWDSHDSNVTEQWLRITVMTGPQATEPVNTLKKLTVFCMRTIGNPQRTFMTLLAFNMIYTNAL